MNDPLKDPLSPAQALLVERLADASPVIPLDSPEDGLNVLGRLAYETARDLGLVEPFPWAEAPALRTGWMTVAQTVMQATMKAMIRAAQAAPAPAPATSRGPNRHARRAAAQAARKAGRK